jgi:hypothetical protein
VTIFAWRPERTGFTYWFSRLSFAGIGLGVLCWISIRQPGAEAAIEQEYGMPGFVLTAIVVVMGMTSGAFLGLLNRWVATRSAAAIVGMVAVLPTSAVIGYVKLSAAGKFSAWNLTVGSVVLAGIVGGLWGAILYSAPKDQ